MIPLGNNVFALVDDVDLLPALTRATWHLTSEGYACARLDYDLIFLHWFIAERMGLVIVETVDHKDRNRLNNRRENIRLANRSEQSINREIQNNNKSGYKCISWEEQTKKWRVKIQRERKVVFTSLCQTVEEAVRQRDSFLARLKC